MLTVACCRLMARLPATHLSTMRARSQVAGLSMVLLPTMTAARSAQEMRLGVPGVLTVATTTRRRDGHSRDPNCRCGRRPSQCSECSGNANLNGYLDPVLVNGFVPAIGQSFTFINYASLTGSFSHIQNQVFDHGRKRWLLIYNPTAPFFSL